MDTLTDVPMDTLTDVPTEVTELVATSPAVTEPEKQRRTRGPNKAKPNTDTRPAIAQMSGFSDMTALRSAVPDSTMTATPDGKTRKTRIKKDEPVIDPNMTDARYKTAVERMAAFGGSRTVQTAFAVTGKPLDESEKTELDDLTYVASKKYSLDPTSSPLFMGIYTLILLARMIAVRVMGTTSANMWEQFEGLFKSKEAEAKD